MSEYTPEREQLAELAHSQWSGWMDHLFSKCTINENGTATIPKWAVERWQRQAETDYKDLDEAEKNSDREEADRVIKTINGFKNKKKYKSNAVNRDYHLAVIEKKDRELAKLCAENARLRIALERIELATIEKWQVWNHAAGHVDTVVKTIGDMPAIARAALKEE